MTYFTRGRRADAWLTCLLLIMLLLLPAHAAAGGILFEYGPESSLLEVPVKEERAVIVHQEGIQRMFVSLDLQGLRSAVDSSLNAVWIFPVPGTSDRVSVEATSSFPELKGESVEESYHEVVDTARNISLATQPHFLTLKRSLFEQDPHPQKARAARPVKKAEPAAHKAIHQWTIHAELVTANSLKGLADFLRANKAHVAEDRLRPLADYVSGNHVLIVAWLRSHGDLSRQLPQSPKQKTLVRPTLYVQFPTKKPVYPLRPDPGFRLQEVHVKVDVLGWMKLGKASWKPSRNRDKEAGLTHYLADRASCERGMRESRSRRPTAATSPEDTKGSAAKTSPINLFVQALPGNLVPFTRLEIDVKGQHVDKDLTFVPSSGVRIMHYLGTSPWMMAAGLILLVPALSLLSGGISGKLVFGEWKKWARFGLWNCLTVPALVIVFWWRRTKNRNEELQIEVSGRREALGLGSVAFTLLVASLVIPFFLAFMSVMLLDGEYPKELGIGFVGCLPIVMETLIAAWILCRAGSIRSAGKDDGSEGKARLIPCGIWEALIRVLFMLTPGALIATVFLVSAKVIKGLPRGGEELVFIISGAVGCLLTSPILFTLLLIVASWLVSRVRSLWKKGTASDPTERVIVPGTSDSGAWILLVLASLPVLFTVGVFMMTSRYLPAPMTEFLAKSSVLAPSYCLLCSAMLIAAWVIRKGEWSGPPRTPKRLRLRPGSLPVLLAALVFFTFVMERISRLLPKGLSTLQSVLVTGTFSLEEFFIASFLALIAIVVTLNRNRIALFCHEMNYKSVVMVLTVILGVSAYLTTLSYLTIIISPKSISVDFLNAGAALAFVLGAWIVNRQLNQASAKALRFGALFSILFGILHVCVFAAISALIRSL